MKDIKWQYVPFLFVAFVVYGFILYKTFTNKMWLEFGVIASPVVISLILILIFEVNWKKLRERRWK